MRISVTSLYPAAIAAIATVVVVAVFAVAACDRTKVPVTQPTPGATTSEAEATGPTDEHVESARQVATATAHALRKVAIEVVVPDRASVIPCGEVPEGMSCVPGGWFVRGVEQDPHDCDQSGQPGGEAPTTTPAARVWVSTFHIDQTEVTNAAYQACIEAGDCPEAGPQYVDFDGAEQPITGVSWYDAKTFCEAQEKRLPTEAEFEKASRGTDGAATPFGDEPVDCDVAVIKDSRGRSCGVPRKGPTPATGRVMPVRSRPAGRYGLFHMVGNAEEWVADWFSRDWASCGDDCLGVDPRGPCGGAEDCPGHSNRVVRGGSWYWPAEHATGYHRRPHIPSNKLFHHFGFRCARAVATSGPSDAPE